VFKTEALRPKDEWIKTNRLIVLTELLREREHTVEQLCRFFQGEATPRDVQRDLQDLEEMQQYVKGFEKTKTRPVKYRIRSQQTTLHPIETLAIHSATRLVYHRARGHNKHYSNALKLIGKWLPDRIQNVVGRSVDGIGQKKSLESSALEQAAEAWFNGHRLKFQYQSANGQNGLRTNELEVYFIEVHPVNLSLYAVGLETTFHHKIRTFKLSRMKTLEVMRDTSYKIPGDFDPQEFFKHAWGVTGQSDGATITVKLRFSPTVARRLEEEEYQHMTLRNEADGSKTATIKAGVDSTGLPLELLVWIRGWGPNVDVLKPQALRTRWLEDCREVARRASSGKGERDVE
jgi:predicted DNA-binding transcriptional regulator YafY